MSQPEVIHSFLKGQIGPWAFFRKLVRAGVSVGAALTLTMGLPAVARGEKTADQFREEVRETSPNDFEEIERLLTMVSKAIGTAVENGNLHPLAVAVAMTVLASLLVAIGYVVLVAYRNYSQRNADYPGPGAGSKVVRIDGSATATVSPNSMSYGLAPGVG